MNSTRLTSWSEGLLESAVIAAAVGVPLFVNYYGAQVFELGKTALGLTAAVIAAVGLIVVLGEAIGLGRAADWPEALRQPDRGGRALAAAAGLLLVATGVSTIASISPRYSLAGSPERAQGLVALLAVLALFAASAVVGRRPAARRRIFAAVAAGGVPVAIAALAQAVGLQAVPGMAESDARVFGTLSNPIFLGAYLMLLVPLALARLASAWRDGRSAVAAGWLVAVLLQVAALVLSGSRGPAAGLGAGLLVMGLAWAAAAGRKRLATGALGLGLAAIVGLAALNLALPPDSPVADAPVIGRFAQIGRTGEGSQAVRLRVWSATAELVRATSPGRLAVGHGPETLRFALLPHGRTSIGGPGQGDRLVDRAHNVIFDALTMTGLLGLLAQLAVWAAWLVAAAGAAGLARSARARRPLVMLLALGALGGAAVWFVAPALAGATVAIGLWLGCLAWLALRALQSGGRETAGAGDGADLVSARSGPGGGGRAGSSDSAPRGDGDHGPGGPPLAPSTPVPWSAIGLLGAGAALVVESAFGIQTITTQVVAWILAGLVVAMSVASAGTSTVAEAARPAAASGAAGLGRRLARGRASAGAALGSDAEPSGIRAGVGLGLVFGLAMGGAFYSHLLYGVERTPDTVPVLLALVVSTWLAGLLAALDAGADPIAYALPSLGGAALWYLVQTLALLAARDVGVLYVVLLTWTMASVILAGAFLARPGPGPGPGRGPGGTPFLSGPIGIVYPLVAVGAVALVYGPVAARVRSDMYFRSATVNFDVALASDDEQRFQDAEAIFTRAVGLYPGDDRMYSAWSERYALLGGLVPTVDQQQQAYTQAQAYITQAETLNPAMPYHTFNRGHVQLLFAEQLASQGREEDAATVAAESEVAIQTVFDVVPYDPAIANELALAKLLRGKVEEAVALLEYSRDSLDAENGQTYQLLSRAYTAAGRTEDSEAALQRSLQYADPSQQDPGALLQLGDMARREGDLMRAVTYYEQAVEQLGPRVDWAIMFNLGLLFRDTRQYNAAVQALQAAMTLAEGDPQAQDQVQAALLEVLQDGPGGVGPGFGPGPGAGEAPPFGGAP